MNCQKIKLYYIYNVINVYLNWVCLQNKFFKKIKKNIYNILKEKILNLKRCKV